MATFQYNLQLQLNKQNISQTLMMGELCKCLSSEFKKLHIFFRFLADIYSNRSTDEIIFKKINPFNAKPVKTAVNDYAAVNDAGEKLFPSSRLPQHRVKSAVTTNERHMTHLSQVRFENNF